MTETQGATQQQDEQPLWPAVYEIRVKGLLEGDYWLDWFDGMALHAEPGGETVLRGSVADRTALYGLISRLRDLALPLLSVNRSNTHA
jgi:hypothetical protein